MSTTSGTLITHYEYMTLLLSAASAYDDQFKATKSKQHVMLHELQYDKASYDDYHYRSDNALFDIDCPVSSIQANATKFPLKIKFD
jgi:hypothetical protein